MDVRHAAFVVPRLKRVDNSFDELPLISVTLRGALAGADQGLVTPRIARKEKNPSDLAPEGRSGGQEPIRGDGD